MRRVILFVCVVLVLASGQHHIPVRLSISPVNKVDDLPGDCPYLTKDNHGQPVLSWVRTTSDTTAIFCYAVSTDGGHGFSRPITIPSSNNIYAHSENLPKIIFKPSGEVIAIWGAKNSGPENKYGGLVYYAQSFDEGKTWTEARRLVSDTAGYDQRYADITLLKNGEAAIIWLDNRKTGPEQGSAVYFASTVRNQGFMHESMISRSACPCCRTSLFADSKGNIQVLYRGIIQDSIRDMVLLVSTDGGKSFTTPRRIHNDNWVLNGCPHTGPAMTENKQGLHFAWYTGGNKRGSFYTRSFDQGNSFVHYDSITGQGSHPQLSTLSNENILIAWDENVQSGSGNAFNKRIGLQVRAAEGNPLIKQFITPDTVYATYPVVSATGRDGAVVAYCLKDGNKKHIAFQQVKLN